MGGYLPAITLHAGTYFVASPVRYSLRPVRLLAPLCGSDRVSPANGGFYIQAFGGSVSLPAAGYDYNSELDSSVGGAFTRWNDN